jgi:nickel/cobalt transporter (NicO) family protein
MRLQPAAGDEPDGSDASATAGLTSGADRLTLAFESLVPGSNQGPLAALIALLGAILLGAAHAVAPGHGKTVMAFYLSGRRDGALRSAATVGATVTATHTAGVLLLGLLVSAGTAFAPARLYPWLGLVSGLLVLVVGLSLLRSATNPHTHSHPHPHDHRDQQDDSHPHDDPQPHPYDRGHSHSHTHAALATLERTETMTELTSSSHHGHADRRETPRPARTSRRGSVAVGLAGGLVPSPSALVVFLGASGLGHPWFGVALVVAFGVGMATTLALAGLLVMRLRHSAESRLHARPDSRLAWLLRLAPLVTASTVVLLGAVVAVRGLSGTGLL